MRCSNHIILILQPNNLQIISIYVPDYIGLNSIFRFVLFLFYFYFISFDIILVSFKHYNIKLYNICIKHPSHLELAEHILSNIIEFATLLHIPILMPSLRCGCGRAVLLTDIYIQMLFPRNSAKLDYISDCKAKEIAHTR